MKDDNFVRIVRGPIGSGKTASCCVEIMRRALAQEPDKKGIRRSRWAVIRNTGPELKTTTIKTWLDWFPENTWGRFMWSPPYTHHIKRGRLDLEVIFLALDRPEDVKKLLSLELTGGYINEAREVPKAIFDGLTSRVRRFPSMREGGPTWSGVIADTNSMSDDHWMAIMAGWAPPPNGMTKRERDALVLPKSWSFYVQPPAMIARRDDEDRVIGMEINPEAENLMNLHDSYYPDLAAGKTADWMDVYVFNKIGRVVEGRPVYRDFDRSTHVASEPLAPFPGVDILVGVDFGLTPAAVFGQKIGRRWIVFRELVASDMGTVAFAEELKAVMAEYPDFRFRVTGDPSGDFRAQTDEKTPFMILKSAGIPAQPANSNDPVLRIDAVHGPLQRLVDGNPGLLIDPSCVTIIVGFEGGYQYKRIRVTGERYEDSPNKNQYSHPHDALQYLMLAGGEGKAITTGATVTPPFIAKRNFSPYEHRKANIRRHTISGRI
jgi:hypothetical protein